MLFPRLYLPSMQNHNIWSGGLGLHRRDDRSPRQVDDDASTAEVPHLSGIWTCANKDQVLRSVSTTLATMPPEYRTAGGTFVEVIDYNATTMYWRKL